jgi:hypothetical protein
LCDFFDDYLKDCHMSFLFNGITTPPANLTTGVEQGSALLPILINLYLAPAIYACIEDVKKDWPGVTIQFFVDNGLIHIYLCKSEIPHGMTEAEVNSNKLAYVYTQLVQHLSCLGLFIEHDKTELMHFPKGRKPWKEGKTKDDPGPLVHVTAGGVERAIEAKKAIKYLGLFLDPKLRFHEHIQLQTNKACSTVNALRLLGNSKQGLTPIDKHRLYILCILPIITYGAQLWWKPTWKGQS